MRISEFIGNDEYDLNVILLSNGTIIEYRVIVPDTDVSELDLDEIEKGIENDLADKDAPNVYNVDIIYLEQQRIGSH